MFKGGVVGDGNVIFFVEKVKKFAGKIFFVYLHVERIMVYPWYLEIKNRESIE